jgi:peroxiredoxin
MMKSNFALVSMATALLIVAGCAKSETSIDTAAATSENTPAAAESTAIESTADSAARLDSEIVQTAATVEEPTQPDRKIGQDAPAWENLTGTDDKQHSLKDLADAKAVAVVFTCNSCPVAKAYEDRLVKLATDYKEKGVELVAINVNNVESDKLPAMKERATEKGFNFAYLYDPSQQSARNYEATVTPHAFLLDESRKIVYIGAIDDNMDESKATKNYLSDAIDATLAGKPIETTVTKEVGCGIKYE